jgi:hypothetical protein
MYVPLLRAVGTALLLGVSLCLDARPSAGQPPATPGSAPAAAQDTAATPAISPGGAFLRSLVLPGWGQSAIGSPGRGAVYFALEGGSLWMLHKSNARLRSAREQESWLRETGQLPPGQRSPLAATRRQQVEDWVTLSVVWLFFSAADAYVGAYLRDFDEGVGVLPTLDGGLQLRATVPVGQRP